MSSWYPFLVDSRGNRLGRYWLAKRSSTAEHLVFLEAEDHIVGQVERVLDRFGGVQRAVPAEHVSKYTHCIGYEGLAWGWLRDMLDLLTDVLTLSVPPALDCALALDFYKDPKSHEDPSHWANTAAGELVHKAKYWDGWRKPAGAQLANQLAATAKRHPLYRDAKAVVSVPGHQSGGKSFGVQLAAAVAGRLGKPLVTTSTVSTSRPEAKALGYRDPETLSADFLVPSDVAGEEVIVVDDVFHTGCSMRAVALSARRAGATAVYGLVGARTLRN